MTLAQLRTALQAKGYSTDTATSQTEAINSVYRQVSGLHRWPWLEARSTALAITAGTPTLSLAAITDKLHLDSIRISLSTSSYPSIRFLPLQDLLDKEQGYHDRGVPEFWTIQAGQLRFWPLPDQAYAVTVDYIKDPPDLSADGDTPVFDATYHDVLVWGALREIAFRERDWSARAVANQEYTERLGQMERAYGIRQRQNSGHVKHASEFWDLVGFGYG